MLREEDKCNLLISDYYNCHCVHVSMIMPFFSFVLLKSQRTDMTAET